MERYFSLKSKEGPKDQVGIVLKATSQGKLEDLAGFLTFTKEKGQYLANTNVDLYGTSKKKEEIISLKVLSDARVKISRQSPYSMFLEEISKEAAMEAVRRIGLIRADRTMSPVKTLTPTSPDLNYYL